LRLGDRLFYKASYQPGMKVSPEQYCKAIQSFKFDRLHIVTDMKFWGKLSKKILSGLCFHVGGVGGKDILCKNGSIDNYGIAVDYYNSIFEMLNEFSPIVRYGCKVYEDFNRIRSFDNILFQHGTLSWWAAFISYASRVGVYGPFRPAKGKRNPNLSKVSFSNWFQWS